ncbi:type II toxin-antitoxin system PemK/MazF family toxin [Butyrivibrio sp. AE3004]|uniref:type II toxin-antitoxin system PemK/MazF family toxin n=1 Tax=Butyrivibrio sp. AE3004 TaxID=1506994 RepID=UPI000493DCC5|nr:type II toxin-antitoxin system PemK/MazF family toxin [Butyrivibrio sp. AE3004]
MSEYNQGDIIRITGFKRQLFVIVSKNAFINATGIFHVCPMLSNIQAGPIHIPVCGKKSESGTVICEQIKAIDPRARGCNRVDSLAYEDIMNVSDAVQGIFEYD